MIQERINKLKRETELAEANLLVNIKKASPLNISKKLFTSSDSGNSSLVADSGTIVSSLYKLSSGNNEGIVSLTKNIYLINKIISALKK